MLGIGWTIFFDVLCIPFAGHFMCPFAVTVYGGRYLVMRASGMFGQPLRNPVRVALRRVDMGGLHMDWYANLTLFPLV